MTTTMPSAADQAARCLDLVYPFDELPDGRDELLRLAGIYAQLAVADAVEQQGQALAELLDHIGARLDMAELTPDRIANTLDPEPGPVRRWLAAHTRTA